MNTLAEMGDRFKSGVLGLHWSWSRRYFILYI